MFFLTFVSIVTKFLTDYELVTFYILELSKMNNELLLLTKDASEITQQAAILTSKLHLMNIAGKAENVGVVDPLVFAVSIFTLSCFVGYYVVWKVTPSLHTPLMSITNAISGIIIIGALISSSSSHFETSSLLGFIATFIASINIFGGFLVTERMLEMFRKK